MAPIIISIEGNIGSGKSTILSKIQQQKPKNIMILQEPVDIWENIKDENGETILSKFYKDPAKYAFAFQVMAYTTRLSILRKAIRENPGIEIILCERSLDADREIFAKMLHDDGLIEPVLYQIYEEQYSNTSDEFTLDYIMYIDTDPDVCLKRIIKRNREGESKITIEYLTKCHKYHDIWLCPNELNAKCPIVYFDGNDTLDAEEFIEILQNIYQKSIA
jgi:deoxyadenosine/deoxycytidine kinase